MAYVPYKTKRPNGPVILQFSIRLPNEYLKPLQALAEQLREPNRVASLSGTMAKIVMERLDQVKSQCNRASRT